MVGSFLLLALCLSSQNEVAEKEQQQPVCLLQARRFLHRANLYPTVYPTVPTIYPTVDPTSNGLSGNDEDCVDDPNFIDSWRYTCEDWGPEMGFECSEAVNDLYSVEEQELLLRSCPKSCHVCGTFSTTKRVVVAVTVYVSRFDGWLIRAGWALPNLGRVMVGMNLFASAVAKSWNSNCARIGIDRMSSPTTLLPTYSKASSTAAS